MKLLQGIGFHHRKVPPLCVESVVLTENLKGVHTTPTMYMFDQNPNPTNATVATASGGWQFRRYLAGEFKERLPLVSNLVSREKV